MAYITKTFEKRSELKRLLRFAWSAKISSKNHTNRGQNGKGCFNLRGLLKFPTKTIQERVKVEKVASICLVS